MTREVPSVELFDQFSDYVNQVQAASEELSFEEYLEKVRDRPRTAQLAHARVYGMVKRCGVEEQENGPKLYNFFKDEIFGIDDTLEQLVHYFHSSSKRLETRKRILLLMGPPGSAKSTTVMLLKRGLEQFSIEEDGAHYAIANCPMREEPLHAIPFKFREQFTEEYGVHVEGDLCPQCQLYLTEELHGDFRKFRVRRVTISEKQRQGIGVFQPSDPKCVRGDTYLLSSDGMIRFDELARSIPTPEDEFAPFATTVSSLGGNERASAFYNGGVKPTRMLTLRGGYSLTGSFEHPVLVLRDGQLQWRKLRDVRIGEFVTLQRGQRMFGRQPIDSTNADLNTDVARLLGYLVAEGWHDRHDIEFTNKDRRLIDDVVRIWKALGADPHVYNKGTGKWSVVVCSTTWSSWLDRLGIGRGAANKRVPPAVLRSDEDAVKAFLSGLFWGDATLGSRRSLQSNRFKFSSSSAELVRTVQLMLLNFGIVSFARMDATAHLDHHSLLVHGDDVNVLLSEFPGLASKFLGFPVQDRGSSNWDRIPGMQDAFAEVLRDYRETVGPLSRCPAISKFARYASSSNVWSRIPGRRTVEAFVETARAHLGDVPALKAFSFIVDDLFWLPIVNITEGEDQVWDLTVPGSHSFCANGVMNHNSQDISDLVGSIDLSTIGEFGSESDPRAYRFDGEANVANRGMLEMVEMLKADERFLYLLLTLSQEQSIKAGRFPLIYADEVIVSHTNEAEFNAWIADRKSEALRDRVIVLKFPYNLRVKDEVKIYNKMINQTTIINKTHIDPQALYTSAFFSVLTRLETPKKAGIDIVKKLKLYNGEEVMGAKEKDVRELKESAQREGMDGIGPRYVINQLARALVKGKKECLTTIDALRALKEGLDTSPSISQDLKEKYNNLIIETRKEYDERAKKDIQKAFIHSFEEQANTLLHAYLDNVEAACNKEKVKHPVTDEDMDPDEKLMRSIEEQIAVSETQAKSFREDILIRLSSYARKNKEFTFESHPRLKEAIEKKLFADLKDMVKITTSTRTPDRDQESKLDEVAQRLINEEGYCDVCARELLQYVGALLAR